MIFRSKFLVTILGAGVSLASFAQAKPLIGWAQEAHPDYSLETFVQHLREQKKYGADLVWIGHNNPGYVDKNKDEPGLSYAVYEAMQDEKSPLHGDAMDQALAVQRLLEACRKEGMKAVLAVGYQIQMGNVWNDRHPSALRRQHDGHLFYAGGNSASWLAPAYQRDIQDYYRWVYHEWVRPYKDVIVMLNLADEPHGGDYSSSAEVAFQSESGLTFKQADKTEEGKIKKGHFENLYIVNYAHWSAGIWKAIDPKVRVTMSFCGSHGRFTNFEPSIAAIFRDTPDNFDVTFDAFLIDNQPGDPIDGKHVSALAMFLRQVGDLSERYHKQVWLWPEANNWILSQWSPVKGNISDALFGVTLLRNMSKAAGIHLGGLAIWNLDVKEQGLFRDTHKLTYDPQRMFDKISADFKTPADSMQLRDDVLVWIPESEADYLIGRKGYDYADRIYLLDIYAPLLECGVIPRLNSDNEPSLAGVKTVFLMGKYPPRLSKMGLEQLNTFVQDGGTLVTNYVVLKPASGFRTALLKLRFYWSAVLRRQSCSIRWGRGKVIFVYGHFNEKLRNIVHDVPAHVVQDVVGSSMGGNPGLLWFPQKAATIVYNTNPGPWVFNLWKRHGTLVSPDGSEVMVKKGTPSVNLPHGSWLKLVNEEDIKP